MSERLFQQAEGLKMVPLDTSTRPATFLVQLADGRHLQISSLIYRILDQLTVAKSPQQLAVELHAGGETRLDVPQLVRIIDEVLLPQHLLRAVDQPDLPLCLPAPAATVPALLSLHLRYDLIPGAYLNPLAARGGWLFSPVVSGVLVVLVVIAHGVAYWFGERHAAFGQLPSLWLGYLVFLATLVIHELGHITASHHWGCSHGGIGIGMYFLTPVFYTEGNAVWQLTRWQRVVVDAAGVYFQQLCTIPLAGALLLTGEPTLLWVIVAIDLTLLLNLNVFAKFDGYWLLSDALGIPNLHQRAQDVINQAWCYAAQCCGYAVRQRQQAPFLQALPPWAVRLVIGYAAALLLVALFVGIVIVPLVWRLGQRLPDEVAVQLALLTRAITDQQWLAATAALGQFSWLGLLAANSLVLLLRLAGLLRRKRTGASSPATRPRNAHP